MCWKGKRREAVNGLSSLAKTLTDDFGENKAQTAGVIVGVSLPHANWPTNLTCEIQKHI